MLDDLRRRFLTRFIDSARSRLASARAYEAEGQREPLARELHALAGEASLLAFDELSELARQAEQAADEDRPVAALLDELERLIPRP